MVGAPDSRFVVTGLALAELGSAVVALAGIDQRLVEAAVDTVVEVGTALLELVQEQD